MPEGCILPGPLWQKAKRAKDHGRSLLIEKASTALEAGLQGPGIGYARTHGNLRKGPAVAGGLCVRYVGHELHTP